MLDIQVKEFFDQETFTLTYIVFDQETKDSLIIDPVHNYDIASGSLGTESIQEVISFIHEQELKPQVILETHAHADHLSGAIELKKSFDNLTVGIGKHITIVQETFGKIYNFKDQDIQGEKFDFLMDEDKDLQVGSLLVKTIFTPGHTPACSSYLIGDRLFVGDALFMPDYGTGRCDFPGGCAKDLYHSIANKLYKLPDDTIFYTGHDYQPNGRELRFSATLEESKEKNIQLKSNTSEQEFIQFRTERDKKLKAPKLLLPSIQVNINAGELPASEDNGVRYLKVPLKE